MTEENEEKLLELLIELYSTHKLSFNNFETFTLRELIGLLYLSIATRLPY